MDAMPWEDLCRITLKKSIMASSLWLEHRFKHTQAALPSNHSSVEHYTIVVQFLLAFVFIR